MSTARSRSRARRGWPQSASIIAVLAVVSLASSACLKTPLPIPEPGVRNPVIFVHGYLEDGTMWDAMVAGLQDQGYLPQHLTTWSYNTTSQSNVVTAGLLGDLVDQVLADTGADQVDIVSHSMGSLNSRWCIKFGSCAGKVGQWISLGGANHGTTTAVTCANLWPETVTCHEMSPGSDLLTTLNAAPEVTAGVEWITMWSPNDGIIRPAESTILDGATNIQIDDTLNHLEMASDPGVIGAVYALLEP